MIVWLFAWLVCFVFHNPETSWRWRPSRADFVCRKCGVVW